MLLLANVATGFALYSSRTPEQTRRCDRVSVCSMSQPLPAVAVDLNGVLVDSREESTRSAWLTACELWPDAFEAVSDLHPRDAGARRAWAGGDWAPLVGDGDEGMPNWLSAKVQLLRPVIEQGSDAVLLMRLCADEAAAAVKSENKAAGRRPLSVGEIVTNWGDDLREVRGRRFANTVNGGMDGCWQWAGIVAGIGSA